MTHTLRVTCIALMISAGCSGPAIPDESWESTGETKVRIIRQYREGDDYYTFAAKPPGNAGWQNITTIRRDATGEMPVGNVRAIKSNVVYFYLVDNL